MCFFFEQVFQLFRDKFSFFVIQIRLNRAKLQPFLTLTILEEAIDSSSTHVVISAPHPCPDRIAIPHAMWITVCRPVDLRLAHHIQRVVTLLPVGSGVATQQVRHLLLSDLM